ncbi:MAG: hypothetical protein K6G40_04390 [Eubacterium sp.]|nr:hypothetical protein [Eubacterium sp.]
MKKSKGIVFGIIMSYSMAIGMEIYNIAIKMGFNSNKGGFSTMTYDVIGGALGEVLYMGVLVFIFSNLWGNKIGAAFAARHTDPEKDNPYFCILMRQAGTIAIMCPTMSFVASVLFNIIMAKQSIYNLPIIWLGTVFKNFPMAFFWNMFAAAPFTRFAVGKIYGERC